MDVHNKNDSLSVSNIKPQYIVGEEYKQCLIKYTGREYVLEPEQFNKIINFDRSFKFYNNDDDYPAYGVNNKKINYLEFLYGLNPDNYIYRFKNSNKYDLQSNNILIIDKDFKSLIDQYDVIEFMNNGILITMGKYAGTYKNNMYKINNDDKIEYLMLCNQNILCRLCPISYDKIINYEKNLNNNKRIVWSYHSNGYILGNNNLYIHQIIMDCYGHGKGTKNISVDHIDQNPLNNTYANLKIATREEQEKNSKGIKEGTKRARKHNAKELPEGITHNMLNKYVVYYKECYNSEKDLHREFFKVERHPKLDKLWASSKSNKIGILEKLAQANKVSTDLDNDIYPNSKRNDLPPYINIINFRDRPHLVYDKRDTDGKRLNLKMILPQEYALEEQLDIFQKKIQEKY
jgi:hypothetical protein